ncbi:MAG: hypothetical protein U5P41_10930 [Gammaproteobacteria bacterium]|nr:hypothetical protein [Gammaproteobacteria bacterium]
MKQAQQHHRRQGASEAAPPLKLGIPGFAYADLHDPARLGELLEVFDREAAASHPELFAEFQAYRQSRGKDLTPEQISDLLVRMTPLVGDFVARLFNVTELRAEQAAAIRREVDTIFGFKNEVVAKAKAAVKKENPDDWDSDRIRRAIERLTQLLGDDHADIEFRTTSAGLRLHRAAEVPESDDAQTVLKALRGDD